MHVPFEGLFHSRKSLSIENRLDSLGGLIGKTSRSDAGDHLVTLGAPGACFTCKEAKKSHHHNHKHLHQHLTMAVGLNKMGEDVNNPDLFQPDSNIS